MVVGGGGGFFSLSLWEIFVEKRILCGEIALDRQKKGGGFSVDEDDDDRWALEREAPNSIIMPEGPAVAAQISYVHHPCICMDISVVFFLKIN